MKRYVVMMWNENDNDYAGWDSVCGMCESMEEVKKLVKERFEVTEEYEHTGVIVDLFGEGEKGCGEVVSYVENGELVN